MSFELSGEVSVLLHVSPMSYGLSREILVFERLCRPWALNFVGKFKSSNHLCRPRAMSLFARI